MAGVLFTNTSREGIRMMIPGRGLFTGGKMRSEDRWRFWRECLGEGAG